MPGGAGQAPHKAPRRVVVVAAKPAVDVAPTTPSTAPSGGRQPAPSGGPPPPGPPDGKPSPPSRPERSWGAIFLDQSLDTFGDVLRHARRTLLPLPAERSGGMDRLVAGPDGLLRLQTPKPVVLVLGSGWGAHSLIKVVDTDTFDVVVVSPRNHFVFTPMLPSCAVGTVEFRSVLEPVRVSNPFVTYFEATVDALDLQQRCASCTSGVAYEDGRRPTFEVPYDLVVVAVGERPATLGVPGVTEHAYFLKEVMDTVRLRQRISECFELASLPGTSNDTRNDLLRFVVVGGGPTGVEFAGTLGDFVRVDLRKRYPELMPFVSVLLLQSSSNILTQFDARLQASALDSLAQGGITVRTGVRVAAITKDQVRLSSGESFGYGVCVWSAGNAARPLVQKLVEALPPQQALQRKGAPPSSAKLVVDPYLRVVGVDGVLAMGDCASILGNPLPATAQVAAQQGAYLAHLVNRGYGVGLGGEDMAPPSRPKEALPEALLLLQALLRGGRPRAAETLAGLRSRARKNVALRLPRSPAIANQPTADSSQPLVSVSLPAASPAPESAVGGSSSGPCATPMRAATAATAAAAGPAGDASVVAAAPVTPAQAAGGGDVEEATPFEFLSLGIMAYVGANSAIQQIEAGGLQAAVSGQFAYLLWRSVYITKQVSFRNRVLILFDWLKTQVFGRDLSML